MKKKKKKKGKGDGLSSAPGVKKRVTQECEYLVGPGEKKRAQKKKRKTITTRLNSKRGARGKKEGGTPPCLPESAGKGERERGFRPRQKSPSDFMPLLLETKK